jgi:hypothetical protein
MSRITAAFVVGMPIHPEQTCAQRAIRLIHANSMSVRRFWKKKNTSGILKASNA